MKKIAIILSSIAAAVLFAAGCNQEPMTGADLDNLKADRTYVAIDTLGGSADINLTATESWKVMVHTSYEWTDADTATAKEIVAFFKDGTVKLQNDCDFYAAWLKHKVLKED